MVSLGHREAPGDLEVIGLGVHELAEGDVLEVRPLVVHELDHPTGDDEGPPHIDDLGPKAAARGLRLVTPFSFDPPVEAHKPPHGSSDFPPEHDGEDPLPARRAPALRVSGRTRAPWLRRRWWVVLMMILAGLAGGTVVTKGHVGSYSAEDLLEVRPGNTPASPGGAEEASALAVTYAALVPSDTAVTNVIAKRLGVAASSVSAGLSATAEAGTSLFVVTYTAPSASGAVAGANEAGAVLASAAPPGLAIVERSVAVVRTATSAKRGRDMRLYGEVGGGVGGLLLGIVFLLALERTDARVDDPEDAAEACGCPATRFPGGMSARELAVAVSRSAVPALPQAGPVTVVPLSVGALRSAERLGRLLASSWPQRGAAPVVPVVAPYSESPEALSEGTGPTILAACVGEPVRSLAAATARLRLLGREPVFVVVCPGS